MNPYYRFTVLTALAFLAAFGFLRLGQVVGANSIAELSYRPKPVEARTASPLSAAELGRQVNVPILMYHHVGGTPIDADGTRRDLTVSSQDFTEQIKWLADHNYQSVTLNQVHEAALGQLQLPQRPIVLSFDDGYADVFANAVPVLKAKGYSGSFAVITQYVGTPDYATWDQLRAAQTQGMEIVSHTQNHFDGSSQKFDYNYIKSNLFGSREDLMRELGTASDIIVYPYGHYTPDYIRAAGDAGFHMGLTTAFGKSFFSSQLMTVPRVRVHGGESLDRFIEILQGAKQIPQTATSHDSL